MCLETGLSRNKSSINVALKNIADFGIAVVVFWSFGFALMYGTSVSGLFGTKFFSLPLRLRAIRPILFSKQCLLQQLLPSSQVQLQKD